MSAARVEPEVNIEERLAAFVEYVSILDGDEKGESQVYCDRLFQAFGWPGYKEAGATLEKRVAGKSKTGKATTKYVDLVWHAAPIEAPPNAPPVRAGCVIEMKRRGEKLEHHYHQVRDYWMSLVPHQPRYAILCNFDDFWIYDFRSQQYEPVDRVALKDLPTRYLALGFLLPEPKKPQFGNDLVAVTREAADRLATLFNRLVKRGVERARAQRFVLQCVVSLFAEDINLLPRGLFTELIEDCRAGANAYDLLGDLFRWMNSDTPPRAGRFKGVRYFNGGLFQVVDPVDLRRDELDLLAIAARENWSKVQPAIFGTLFQSSMDQEERHALGAHYTSEADIQKVVQPTIARPWRERIAEARTREALMALRAELEKFQVLDPACGSGNFLYVAYRELVRVEMDLINRLREEFPSARAGKRAIAAASFIDIRQFHGIDVSEFAVELAKVTLLLAKKLAYDEVNASAIGQLGLSLMSDPLPLANLNDNIRCEDALFVVWPPANAIIGNPPYQSKNKMQDEYGAAYVSRVRKRYPGVPGRADYCVYWLRRAHDHLAEGQRAGLVGTNTIRQNYSREGGLDYIVGNGGTITEAVSTQVWSGEAQVHVSIVNWIKGEDPAPRHLYWQEGDAIDSPFQVVELDHIPASLSPNVDVTQARPLAANASSGACYQGQTHGHKGFLLSPQEARALCTASRRNADVVHPFLIADDLLGPGGTASRWVIDFQRLDLHAAASYKEPFARIKQLVLPTRKAATEREQERNEALLKENPQARVNRHHAVFLDRWWQLSWARPEMIERLSALPRYVVCAQVTRRPIFEFICASIRPNAALIVFPLADDYSFGILQSSLHWQWFVARCSTLKGDFRYTSDTVFDSFPWPQEPTTKQVRQVAEAALRLRKARRQAMERGGLSRRDLYRQLEEPGRSDVRDAHSALDFVVREAYGITVKTNVLSFLLALNHSLASLEAQGKAIVGPGLPSWIKDPSGYVTADCVPPPAL